MIKNLHMGRLKMKNPQQVKKTKEKKKNFLSRVNILHTSKRLYWKVEPMIGQECTKTNEMHGHNVI